MIVNILTLRTTFLVCQVIALIHSSLGIRFNLQPASKKCLKHEMYRDQLAVGEYDVTSLPGSQIDVAITDTKGHIAFKRENIEGKGKFAVTSDAADFYELCFTYHSGAGGLNNQLMPREVDVDFRVGIDAKQHDAIDHDKLSELESDLNRIEDLTNAIIEDFAYLKKREREMRDTNESTNTRLFYQTVTSVIILLVLTVWQVLYLRTFFKSRKLID